MAIDNFIPEIWSSRIKSNLKNAHVAAKLVNRDYEGEIKNQGDTVHINSIGRITVKPYVKNVAIDDPEILSGDQTTLLIDQGRYFNFYVDDIDKKQQNPKVMSEATQDAAHALADVADKFIFGMYGDAHADNKLGSDTVPLDGSDAGFDIYKTFTSLRKLLNKKNVPKADRWALVDAEIEELLLNDDRFARTGTARGDEVVAKGQLGTIAGFTIYASNNAPVVEGTTGAISHILAGTKAAISYAEQILETTAFKPEKHFGDAVKALHVYGGKVVRPEALAVAHIDVAGDYTA